MTYGALARRTGVPRRAARLGWSIGRAQSKPGEPSLTLGLVPRLLTLALLGVVVFCGDAFAQSKPNSDYLFYVVSEGADKIALVRFGSKGARVEREVETGDMPIDIDGPHGVVRSPDRKFYYVSIGHGRPFGLVWKYSTKDDSVAGKATLGYFPATMDVSADGQFLFVVNFNLHGDMVPSSVSVEIGRAHV